MMILLVYSSFFTVRIKPWASMDCNMVDEMAGVRYRAFVNAILAFARARKIST